MGVELHLGDCLDVLRTLPDNSVDSIVTDPPYELGFMNKRWDSTGIAYDVNVWRECLRVLKPGGHALVWALPRTSHWTATAWENAGFEVRDRVSHIFGSGFPKSLDVSKAIDKAAGAERRIVAISEKRPAGFVRHGRTDEEVFGGTDANRAPAVITAPATPDAARWQGWGTALKPAMEDWWLLRKPLAERTVAANVLAWGCGALNVDGCRIEITDGAKPKTRTGLCVTADSATFSNRRSPGERADEYSNPLGRFPANLILSWPEDEYELRDDVTPDQLRMLAEWLDENA